MYFKLDAESPKAPDAAPSVKSPPGPPSPHFLSAVFSENQGAQKVHHLEQESVLCSPWCWFLCIQVYEDLEMIHDTIQSFVLYPNRFYTHVLKTEVA